MPAELDEISRKIMQHEIEEAALKKEDDRISAAHLAEVQKELAEMREQYNAMHAKWSNEKDAIGKVQKLREYIDRTNSEIEQAERAYDLNKEMAAFKNKRVYVCDTDKTRFFDRIPFHPDVLLREFASILHPELFPSVKPQMYRHLD